MADKGAILVGVLEHQALRALAKLSVDASGQLRTVVPTTTVTGTITAVTNITNWGLLSTTARSQVDAHTAFQTGLRRNLVLT